MLKIKIYCINVFTMELITDLIDNLEIKQNFKFCENKEKTIEIESYLRHYAEYDLDYKEIFRYIKINNLSEEFWSILISNKEDIFNKLFRFSFKYGILSFV